MQLSVSNLGVIKEANVDLSKALNIFCGQNNTGKTYLSYIIYALSKKIHYRHMTFNSLASLSENEEVTFTLNIDKMVELIDYTINTTKRNFNTIFGLSEDQAKALFEKTDVTLNYSNSDLSRLVFEAEVSDKIVANSTVISFSKEAETYDVKVKLIESERKNMAELIDLFIVPEIYKYFAFYPLKGCYILPVERNSIYTFSKELSISRNNLVDQLQNGGDFNPIDLLFNSTNRYPLAISDGLNVANDLANLQKRKSAFLELAEEIELDLLNGKLSITDKGETVFASNKSKTKKLPIHMTASIIKTLSSLIFYLKHLAKKGDMIIIDEPEMNLHPDNQIILTRLFAKLMRNGFRLLISTHSDYIIREFNNLIMLNSTSVEQSADIEELGYGLEERIDPDDVACYFFKFKKANSRQIEVEALPIDKTGVAIPTIDDTVDKQNLCAEELSYLIVD